MNTHSNAKQIEKKISMTRAFEALPAEIGPEVKMLVARELKKKKKILPEHFAKICRQP